MDRDLKLLREFNGTPLKRRGQGTQPGSSLPDIPSPTRLIASGTTTGFPAACDGMSEGGSSSDGEMALGHMVATFPGTFSSAATLAVPKSAKRKCPDSGPYHSTSSVSNVDGFFSTRFDGPEGIDNPVTCSPDTLTKSLPARTSENALLSSPRLSSSLHKNPKIKTTRIIATSQLHSMTQCPICTESFDTNPLAHRAPIAPSCCGNNVCRECVRCFHAVKCQANRHVDLFPCPICNHQRALDIINLPKPNFGFVEVLKALAETKAAFETGAVVATPSDTQMLEAPAVHYLSLGHNNKKMIVEENEDDAEIRSADANLFECSMCKEQFTVVASSMHAPIATSCCGQNVCRSCVVDFIGTEKKASRTRRSVFPCLMCKHPRSLESDKFPAPNHGFLVALESARSERSLEGTPQSANCSVSSKSGGGGAVPSRAAVRASARSRKTGIVGAGMPLRAPLGYENERTMEVVWVKYRAKAAWWPGIVLDPMLLRPQDELRQEALLHKNSKVWQFLDSVVLVYSTDIFQPLKF